MEREERNILMRAMLSLCVFVCVHTLTSLLPLADSVMLLARIVLPCGAALLLCPKTGAQCTDGTCDAKKAVRGLFILFSLFFPLSVLMAGIRKGQDDVSAAMSLAKAAVRCIAAPILEELYFRKKLTGMMRPLGQRTALSFGALSFALCHFDMFAVPALFWAGLVLGYIYLKNGSYIMCVLIHMLNNLTALLIGMLPGAYGYVLGWSISIVGTVMFVRAVRDERSRR